MFDQVTVFGTFTSRKGVRGKGPCDMFPSSDRVGLEPDHPSLQRAELQGVSFVSWNVDIQRTQNLFQ